MGPGFLGTDASLMLDVVVSSLVLVLPTLIFSIYLAHWRKNYPLHKRVQLTLGIVLLIVVVLFEIDIRMQGGFWELAKNSPYFDTTFLWFFLYFVHIPFSVSTVVLWTITFWTALRNFPKPPAPGEFSPIHKRLAWTSVTLMVGTVVTGLMVYYFGFIAS